MSDLYKNKYRISSARLQNWNYANPGLYFITICTQNRNHYFGEISVETPCMASLLPTAIGEIAYNEWFKTPELRPDMNLELGEFVVMPNHIHGIIIIGGRDATHGVSTNKTPGVSTKKL
jgi:REP element-mobilizing transposase RayT